MAAELSHFRTLCIAPAISSTKQLTLPPRMTDSMTSISSASAVESAGNGCLDDFHAIGEPPSRVITAPHGLQAAQMNMLRMEGLKQPSTPSSRGYEDCCVELRWRCAGGR